MDNTSNWISAADEVVAIRCKRMPKVYAQQDTWSSVWLFARLTEKIIELDWRLDIIEVWGKKISLWTWSVAIHCLQAVLAFLFWDSIR